MTGALLTTALLFLSSCGTQLPPSKFQQDTPSSMPVHKTAMVAETVAYEAPDPHRAEQDMLMVNSQPYFDENHPLYVGKESTDFLQAFLFAEEEVISPVSVNDLEQVIRLLFHFSEEEESCIRMYITDFSQDDTIERQHAMAGFMKLLSLKYPLDLGGDYENLKKSEAIYDMAVIDDKYQSLVRQAYCLSFTDYTVQRDLRFRPNDLLTHSEALSMISRVLDHFGPPAVESMMMASAAHTDTGSEQSPEDNPKAFGSRSLYQEIIDYRATLGKSKTKASRQKAEFLTLALDILGLSNDDLEDPWLDDPLPLDVWVKVLNLCFNRVSEDISPYIPQDAGSFLTYDIAAMSIFIPTDSGAFSARNVSSEEMEAARNAIPQFETARDTDRLAQMHASGLLDGIITMPGFTPQRPVHRIEAMLLVKRMVESMK
jgi:hypothetical protein